MQLVRTTSSLDKPSVVTIGNFDGLHLGHQALIEKTRLLADAQGCSSVLLSFSPLPRIYFQTLSARSGLDNQNHPAPCQLMDLRTKYHTLKAKGLDYFMLMPFNLRTRALSAQQFVEQILVQKLKAKIVVVGADFRFGQNQEGDIHTLAALGAQYGFELQSISPVTEDGLKIGSSHIKDFLQHSHFKKAACLLGQHYHVMGRVISGKQRGRLLGFATANIHCKVNLPIGGVFAVRARIDDKWHLGVANIGYAPTVKAGKAKTLEVHLFDFDQDIYGALLEVQFFGKLRDEQRFASLDALKNQIDLDCKNAIQLFEDLGLNHG